MKTVKIGSSGIPVRILQATLNERGHKNNKGQVLVVDGKFGKNTDEALRKLQAAEGLKVDGICGDITWGKLYFVPTKNPKIMVMKIPFGDIESANIILRDKKKYSVDKAAKETGCDLVVNAGFFTMDTYQNVADMIVGGKMINGGNYTDKGIAFGNDFKNIGAYASTTANSKGKPVDFMGGCPILIQNGVKNVDLKGIPYSIYTQLTKRNCDGIDDHNYYLMLSMSNCTLEEMVQEGLYQKIKTLRGNDGGGSQSFSFFGETIIFTSRGIPSFIGIKFKKKQVNHDEPEKPSVENTINGVKYTEKIIEPSGIANVRTLKPMNPKYIIVHNTGNAAASAGDEAHAVYLQNLEKADKEYVSWHVTVDCDSATQHLPFNEMGYHAGDGAEGDGNQNGIGIEIAENKDYPAAEENGIKIICHLMKEFGITIDRVWPHRKFARNKKLCPHLILKSQATWEKDWSAFRSRIMEEYEKLYHQPKKPKITHTVSKGETLSGIAKKYGTSYLKIAEINSLNDPSKIYPGQKLIIQ
jgi:N-acetylmuramoyl-L-alanine amidase CwlA/peptidoglycan hydrolase-like protein with peptidoglycan-binding domain